MSALSAVVARLLNTRRWAGASEASDLAGTGVQAVGDVGCNKLSHSPNACDRSMLSGLAAEGFRLSLFAPCLVLADRRRH